MKNGEEKKVVLPEASIGCMPYRGCCAWGNDCPGLHKYVNGRYVFVQCGC